MEQHVERHDLLEVGAPPCPFPCNHGTWSGGTSTGDQRMKLTVRLCRLDLQAACDLLWSLAFNNTLLKEVIGQQGGIPVIIRGMKMHPSSADFLKSACGALSNMCQNAHNQTLISTHGGIYSMLQILENHRENTILLPFVFDAMASLIVGNQVRSRDAPTRPKKIP